MKRKSQDYVWQSCLPREFKDEVKRMYRIADSDVDQMIATIMLENVFGRHNLTSDAEGDEMLTCVKDRVVKLYNIANKAYAINGVKYYQGYMNAMIDLFGSKCLPDEEEKMTEERYQYLNSLSLEDYDNETSADEQRQFCEYQHKHHPDEVIYFQTHSDEEPNPAEPKEEADEHFDTIVKGGFRNERRLNIAAQITASIYANDKAASRFDSIEALVRKALDIADTLIAECEKGGNHD